MLSFVHTCTHSFHGKKMSYSQVTVDTYLNGFGNESTIAIKRSVITWNLSFEIV